MPKVLKIATILASFSVALLAPSDFANAVDNNLFEQEHSCRSALSEYRNNPSLAAWANNADCHWHPELGPRGMRYLY
ncbi:hypothetical protein [Corynebacterium sp. LK2510]|uniref:hypothetical protein n=1 Tax=Corynebacterium sp. LK2510 TaxID=3110472 RepID=UPI0034CFDCD8